MSMRVMVTGGAGFIGSHVADALLAAGHEVGVIDDLSTGSRDNLPATVPLHVIDIRDRDAVFAAFAAFRPEVVCHQAAQMSVSRSVREPLFDAEVNTIGLINVLDAAVAQKCGRVVFASSGGVLYGEQTSPAPEETPADPVSPYGITKWVGERYLKFYAAEHGLGAMALRYANLLALTASDAAIPRGQLTSLNIGTGIGTDVVALEARIRQGLVDVMKEAGQTASYPAPLHGAARPGDLRSNLVDASRAGTVLGWRPEVGLEEGISRTAAWFVAQQAAS